MYAFLIIDATATPISLKKILRDTKEVTDWHTLGIYLGVKSSILKRIEKNYSGDTERCKTEVIHFWLQNDSEPTWNRLARAVEDMGGYANVVQTLRANHKG